MLELLRLGLTDREIAERLGISLRGAKFHVSEILGRTGASDRRAAAGLPPLRRRWGLLALPTFLRRARLGASWLPAVAAGTVVVALAAGLALLAWGISRTGGNGSGAATVSSPAGTPTLPPGTATSAAEALALAQLAVDGAPGYHVEVTGHNLVLPQWGGIDGGSIDVDIPDAAARADIYRTGDGRYVIVSGGGETQFQRETCAYFTRIPGGGAGVLEPFLFNRSGALRGATNPVFLPSPSGGPLAIQADLPDLGTVRLDLDPVTFLPLRLQKPASADSDSETTWTFSQWDERPEIGLPGPADVERGPGGNPC